MLYLQADLPLVIGVDDTTTDKIGKKILASGYFYDSKSPPFASSFKWALRFITNGRRLATPNDIRKDDNIPYQTHRIFAAGKWHDLRYKTIAPVL